MILIFVVVVVAHSNVYYFTCEYDEDELAHVFEIEDAQDDAVGLRECQVLVCGDVRRVVQIFVLEEEHNECGHDEHNAEELHETFGK